ncbi:hypothetical protein TcasGA2_TC010307 [Tribolium castaneum]|uniref:Uncharacterized protein n=1 Tax=Tribolium castaneum TaxID=7070 RepID=D7EKK0_TRICA|nr:hypothetical protein TcasGA2_TC010307 [Tribolium castaneum]
MIEYSNEEYADMHFVFGECNDSVSDAVFPKKKFQIENLFLEEPNFCVQLAYSDTKDSRSCKVFDDHGVGKCVLSIDPYGRFHADPWHVDGDNITPPPLDWKFGDRTRSQIFNWNCRRRGLTCGGLLVEFSRHISRVETFGP